MGATEVLQKCLRDALGSMHALRSRVLLRAVEAMIQGSRLTLIDLARSWPDAERVRAPLKALDRLLGNRHLHVEREHVYKAMARWLVRNKQPTIVIDWSDLKSDRSWHLLRAAIPVGGRSLPILDMVFPGGQQGSPKAERRFLQRLAQVLPDNAQPILVTDAGFRGPWFRAVEAMGWQWLGRLRNTTYLKPVDVPDEPDEWVTCKAMYGLATRGPRDFGAMEIARSMPLTSRVVLHAKPPKGRKQPQGQSVLFLLMQKKRADIRPRKPQRRWMLFGSGHPMPRLPRIDLPHIPQHIVQRGNDRQQCFFTEADYMRYLSELREISCREGCRIHAYVLMTNHVHLLMTPSAQGQVSRVMQALGRRYVRYVNDRYRRTGTLWEGRYKSCLIDSDAYLLRCYRYIELNPVRAHMVVHPGDYRWPSYATHAMGKDDALVHLHALYLALGATPAERCEAYRALVAEASSTDDLDSIRLHLQRQHALGSDRFRSAIEVQLARRVGPAKIGRPRKTSIPPKSAL